MSVQSQSQSCPRRLYEVGPWSREENLDSWSEDRWGREDDKWEWEWKPRTCSFCGGVNPEDAIRLVREGWNVESTDKSYKCYLNPPGGRYPEEYKGVLYLPSWHPTPPVKVYFQHFSEDDIGFFNGAVVEGRIKRKKSS